MAKKSIEQLDLKGRRVFLRVDFNVPLTGTASGGAAGATGGDTGGAVVGDDTRIRASVPTIQYALAQGTSTVVLASHLGRPKGKPNADMSLKPVADRLAEILGVPVRFASDCIGPAAVDATRAPGVVLLENLRFHPEEEKDGAEFAAQLAALADVYVNDAFGAAHRAHASVHAIVPLMREAGAGLLMERELRYLGQALGHPERPFAAVIGGAKVSDKIEVIENLIPRVDELIIGGAMAYTFFTALGYPTGRSLVEQDKVEVARDVMAKAKARDLTLLLPTDHVVAERPAAGVPTEVMAVDDASIGDRMGLDIGPHSIATFGAAIAKAHTVIWNGPMGVFEIDAFAAGTMAMAQAVAAVRGTTIIGGGDSIAAVHKAGVADRITHISTGGGASLEFLGGQVLPGVAVLPEA